MNDPIFSRVSIRQFEERKVEEEKVYKILRAAMASPSACNQQPWEFYLTEDKEVIQALSESSPYAGCAKSAPCLIVVCYRKEHLTCPELVGVDCGICCENILLEITNQGLGGVMLAIYPIEERMKNVSRILKNDEVVPFALIPFGYPLKNHPQEDRFDKKKIHRI